MDKVEVKIYGQRTFANKEYIKRELRLQWDNSKKVWHGMLDKPKCDELRLFCEKRTISYDMPMFQKKFVKRFTRDFHGVPMWQGYKVKAKKEICWVEERR